MWGSINAPRTKYVSPASLTHTKRNLLGHACDRFMASWELVFEYVQYDTYEAALRKSFNRALLKCFRLGATAKERGYNQASTFVCDQGKARAGDIQCGCSTVSCDAALNPQREWGADQIETDASSCRYTALHSSKWITIYLQLPQVAIQGRLHMQL